MKKFLKWFVIVIVLVVLVVILTGYKNTVFLSFKNLWAKQGECAQESKKIEGRCIAGKIFIQPKPGIAMGEVEKVLSKYNLSISYNNPNSYYWKQSSIQIWNLETLVGNNIPQDLKVKWDSKLKDPLVHNVAFYPVTYSDGIRLKAIISFIDTATLDQVKNYLTERGLLKNISTSLEGEWYEGGQSDNFFYITVPSGEEQKYVDALKKENILKEAKLVIFESPHIDGGRNVNGDVPHIDF
jgi:hypothetical protein